MKFRRAGIPVLLLCCCFWRLSLGSVTVKDSVFHFRTFRYEIDTVNKPDWFLAGPFNEIVTREFAVKVIENEYIRLILLPEFGGRIISFHYKPTGHEELYQANPATSYRGPISRTFYYDYLVVPGGIYPTFPEPEHGKTWNQKWSIKVVKETLEEAAVEMSYLDDKYDYSDEKWWHGITQIRCTVRITVFKGLCSFTFNVKLENTNASSMCHEYWTCATLTPGSDPDNPVSPLNTEIIIDMERAQYKSNWWGWMNSADTQAPSDPGIINLGGSIHYFENLRWYKNWNTEGIAYAYPVMDKNYWGAINHDRREGILRIADNRKYTPGLKIWTWGKESINANISDPNEMKRSHMEIWGGHSREFFVTDTMDANEIRQWDEFYYPIVGLNRVDTATEKGAVQIEYQEDKPNETAYFIVNLSTVYPQADHSLDLRAVDQQNKEYKLFQGTKPFPGNQPIVLKIDQNDKKVPKGKYTIYLKVKDKSGEYILDYNRPITVTAELNPSGKISRNAKSLKSSHVTLRQRGDYLQISNPSRAILHCCLYDLRGRICSDNFIIQKKQAKIPLRAKQCFILRIGQGDRAAYYFLIP